MCLRRRQKEAKTQATSASSRSADSELHASGADCNARVESTQPIVQADLDESMQVIADVTMPWKSGSFTLVQKLQEAARNHGCVDAMSHHGNAVAVKRIPNWLMRESHQVFQDRYPDQLERPWYDVGILAELQQRQFPYICDLIGIFRDETWTYTVSSLASHGDLFSWAQTGPTPGRQREAMMQPIVTQLCSAIRLLHDLGVAHKDLSLENILLTSEDGVDAPLQVKLIDFGMAGLGQTQGGTCVGKDIYRAPEVHSVDTPYDAFLADEFALGVVLYAMALMDYPWASTEPGTSEAFEYARKHGMAEFLAQRRVRSFPIVQILSPSLLELVAGLAAAAPVGRLTAGEACYQTMGRATVWNSRWLQCSSSKEASVHHVASNASMSTAASDNDDEHLATVALRV